MKLARFILVFVFVPFAIGSCATSKHTMSPDSIAGDPWIRAARTSDVSTLKKMIDEGRHVDTPNLMGVTALMTASRTGAPEMVFWLLEQGADASKKDKDGQSALVYALVGSANGLKLERIVEELIRRGADPFAIDALGFQPVQHMLELDMDDQIRKLDFTDVKPCDRLPAQQGEVTISRAARRLGKIALAEFLEAAGCW